MVIHEENGRYWILSIIYFADYFQEDDSVECRETRQEDYRDEIEKKNV